MKHWTTKLLIFFLLILLGISAYNYFQKPFLKDKNQSTDLKPTVSVAPTKIPKKELNAREKIAQLLVVPLDLNELDKQSTASANMLAFIKENDPGFVLYFGEKVSTNSAILASKTIYGSFAEDQYAPLIAVDHEGGLVQRLSGEGFTKLESWQKIVTTYSSAQQKAVFNQSSKNLAPSV